MKKLLNVNELDAYRADVIRAAAAFRKRVRVCAGDCRAFGADEVAAAFRREIERRGLEPDVDIRATGCLGLCNHAPVVVIDPLDVFYQFVSPDDVPTIVGRTMMVGKIIHRLSYTALPGQDIAPLTGDIPFFAHQDRRLLGNCGVIDPLRIEHSIERGGYAAAVRALSENAPERLIEDVRRSGLRGRGGAGEYVWRRWDTIRRTAGGRVSVECVADSSDPFSSKDRAILEGDPHGVMEGMLITAFILGANRGVITIPGDRPYTRDVAAAAIGQARALGLIGDNILNTKFDFHINIKDAPEHEPRNVPAPEGAAAVCAHSVETYAAVRLVISGGPEQFAAVGTRQSPGTKVFSLGGRVNNTGLIEIPLGTTVRKIVEQIGGGISRGRRFKALLAGGPGGGFLHQGYLDCEVDYESLAELDTDMGAGGLLVLDENTCIVETTRQLVERMSRASCGRCTPCRAGTVRMSEILTRLTRGAGRRGDPEALEHAAIAVRAASTCKTGRSAAAPVLSSLKFFRDEYEAHLHDRRCPAGVCEALVGAPCRHACPAGVDVPRVISMFNQGDYAEAASVIREQNPFPGISGRLCHHPCEVRCRRGEMDEPVAIRALERFAADRSAGDKKTEPFARYRNERVAVAGAGPAGLSCAYFLAAAGYGVTVFEAMPMAGGMLAAAVPEYRLPAQVVIKEIETIQARGIEIRCNAPINENHTVEDLLSQGYDAVFLSVGAQSGNAMSIPGEIDGLGGLYNGVRFLRDLKMGRPAPVGERVVVIGGGNTALYAARAALRLGARKVDVFYRRAREEMPSAAMHFEDAAEEGVSFHFLIAPVRIFNHNWRVTGMECVRVKLGRADSRGRRPPIPVPGSEFPIPADTVIVAVGRAPDLSFIPRDSRLKRTIRDTLEFDPATMETSLPGVFAGGDVVVTPVKFMDAVAAGKRGAEAVIRYLGGDFPTVRDFGHAHIGKGSDADLQHAVAAQGRVPNPKLSGRARIAGFAEIETGFTELQARQESRRCLLCERH